MPTLQLMTPPACPDNSHRISSPGGYEFWHFYVEDHQKQIRLAISFHDGFALHPDYIKQYAAYLRHPTRNRPPTPSQYPCLHLTLLENGNELTTSTIYFPPGSFKLDGDRSILLGASRASFQKDAITVTVADPRYTSYIELLLRPILQPAVHEESFPPANGAIAEHFWLPSRPLCEVVGRIQHAGRTISIAGLGQHNHCYGTRPMSAISKRWIRGCVLFPRIAEMFQATDDSSMTITADEAGLRRSDTAHFSAQWKRNLVGHPTHPHTMQFGDRIILRNPTLLKRTPRHLEMLYDAYIEGEQNTAWIEIDCP